MEFKAERVMRTIMSALASMAMALDATPALAQAPSAAADCGAVITAACAERLGAGALAPTDDVCQEQWAAYRGCIQQLAAGAVRDRPSSGRAACSESRAQSLCADTKTAHDCLGYVAFREACPNTPEARLALVAMRRLDCAAPGAAAAAAATPSAGAPPAPSAAAPRQEPSPKPRPSNLTPPRSSPSRGAAAPGFRLAARKEKNIRRFRDLGRSTICMVNDSRAARVIWRYSQDIGQQIYVYHFITLQEALAAYDQDRCDAIALWSEEAEARIAGLSDPDAHRLIADVIPAP